MNRFTSVALALGSLLVGPLVGLAFADESCPATATQIIGHRGTGTNGDAALPENTIVSFQRAVVEGATMIELDVQLSSDGVLYVMHDDTVDRTTDGTGCMGDLSAAQLDALDADGESVPTFAQVLSSVEIPINIEIKVNEEAACPETDRPALARELVAVLGADPTPRDIIVSSFDLDQLLALRTVDDTVALAFLTAGREGFDVAIEQGFAAVNPLALVLREEDVDLAQAAGVAVNPWTVNDDLTYQRLLRFEVDGIITDEPDLLVTAIESYCAELCTPDAGPDTGVMDAGLADVGASDGGADAGMGGGGGCSASGGQSSWGWLLMAVCFRRRRTR